MTAAAAGTSLSRADAGGVQAGKPVEPRRALTAVRGIAAWWVVVYHFREALPACVPSAVTGVISRGYLAVDLFFVLSGYVIGLNYGSWFECGAFSPARHVRFLVLRLSRIYPLHAALLALFLVNPVLIALFSTQGLPPDMRAGYYVLSVFLMQAWAIVPGTAWNVPAWSISAEWLAYILFPLLAMAAARLAPDAGRAAACVVALLATLAAATAASGLTSIGSDAQWYGLLRCLSEFSVGIGLFRMSDARPRARWEAGAATAVAALCFAVFALRPQPDYLLVPLGCAALVYGLADEGTRAAALLRWRPLQWLGLVSYATYMCHYLLKTWVKFVLVKPGVPPGAAFAAYVAVVLAASALLHEWIEQPWQRRLRRLAGPAKT